jgi:hypothetical protein
MRNAMEYPGSDRFQRGTGFGSRHSFLYRPVNEQTFRPKGVPCGEQSDHERGNGNFPYLVFHFHISFS